MRAKILIILTFAAFAVSSAQNYHEFKEDNWLGTWKGTLNIIYPSSSQSVPMTLEVSKTETPGKYTWKTVYGESPKTLEKKYFIYAKDAEKGQWILDENNNILIDIYLADNVMYTIFEVKGALLNSVYTNSGNSIVFEVLSAKSDTPVVTGQGNEEVKSYPVYVLQKAVLTK
ncbi:MAG: hypothetical protein LWX07_04755 [Bacteroidetes bacterium]|nr:hypothetical protein [Bacteroidota bacterium]